MKIPSVEKSSINTNKFEPYTITITIKSRSEEIFTFLIFKSLWKAVIKVVGFNGRSKELQFINKLLGCINNCR